MNLHGMDLTPLRLSLQVGLLATVLCVLVGLPVAWWTARARPLVRGLLSSAVLLPLLLPPTVVGYYVLYVLGQQSGTGRFLIDVVGLRLVFTWQGAAVAAAVVALPLFVLTAQAGFEQIDEDVLSVARTLAPAARVFVRVVLPMAWPSVLAGTLLAFARAAGEFGAAVMVAGNIPGRTQTASVAIYDAIQAGDHARANRLAAVFLLLGLGLLAALAIITRRRHR
jgi:molybdate transport system permease protein